MIKAETRYDGKHKFAQQKFRKGINVNSIIMFVLEMVWVITNTLYGILFLWISNGSDDYRKAATYFLGFAAVLVFIMILSFVKRQKQKKKLLAEPPEEMVRIFTFTENSVEQERTSREEWGSMEISYDGIGKALETKDFFVFSLVDKIRVYSIAKNEITEGTAEELSALFSEKLGNRFRRRCK